MHKFGVLVLVAVAVFAVACSGGQTPAPRFEAGDIQLEKYPVLSVKQPMTDDELEDLGLRLNILEKPLAVFNHYRALGGKPGAWKWETLPVGTQIAVDFTG